MRYLLLIIPCLLLIITSCGSSASNTIIGTWSAISVIENDKPLEVDLSVINFTFEEDNTYSFTSTLDYKEAGAYSLEGNNLFTLDSLNQGTSGKIVLVEKLVSDTLQLKMKKEDDWMVVTLVKD